MKFWHTRTWHRLRGHTVTYKRMPLPEFDSQCSCGTWWFDKNFEIPDECEVCGHSPVDRRGVWDYCPKGHTYVGIRSEHYL